MTNKVKKTPEIVTMHCACKDIHDFKKKVAKYFKYKNYNKIMFENLKVTALKS